MFSQLTKPNFCQRAFIVATLALQALASPYLSPESQDGALSARQSQTYDPGYADSTQFRLQAVNDHNFYRAQHSAPALKWSPTLANSSNTWVSGCKYGHSGTPGFGENIALGYSRLVDAINAWGLERVNYNFDKPGFSSSTGHFTQMVWKSTTKVGCARKLCTVPGFGSAPVWYLVCQYAPSGNVVNPGFFQANVGRQISGNPKVGIAA